MFKSIRCVEIAIGIGVTAALLAARANIAAAQSTPYSYGLLPAQSSGGNTNDDSSLIPVGSGYYCASFDSSSGSYVGNTYFDGFSASNGAGGNGGYIGLAGFGHQYNGFFGSSFTTGDPAMNTLLRTANYADGSSVGAVTFNKLTAGQTYEAQFLVADTRSSQIGRSIQIANNNSFNNGSSGDYASAPLQYAYGGATNVGAYVDWTFTASADSQTFYDRVTNTDPGSSQYGTPQGTQINAALVTPTAEPASQIWYGNPADSTSVFKHIDIETSNNQYVSNPSGGASVSVQSDPAYGQVYDFTKPAGYKRVEAHGAAGFDPAVGHTYYLGWAFNLSNTVTDNAIFQWKAYGSPMTQDFPIVLKCINGDLTLQYYAPGIIGTNLFSMPIHTNTWYQSVIEIGVSDSTSGGTIRFWLNGMQQIFSNGSTEFTGKTFDGSSVDPKWGIYGAVNSDVTNRVADLRIGNTYADVAPPGPNGAMVIPVPEPATLAQLALAVMAGMFLKRFRLAPRRL